MSSSEHDEAAERLDGAQRESGGLDPRTGKDRARDSHLLDLQMQARYHRDRHRLYAARVGGSRPTSLSKLEDLRRVRELAEGSLRRVEADQTWRTSESSGAEEPRS